MGSKGIVSNRMGERKRISVVVEFWGTVMQDLGAAFNMMLGLLVDAPLSAYQKVIGLKKN